MGEHPLDLVREKEKGGDRGGVVGLVLGAVVPGGREVQERRDPPAGGGDLGQPLDRGR